MAAQKPIDLREADVDQTIVAAREAGVPLFWYPGKIPLKWVMVNGEWHLQSGDQP